MVKTEIAPKICKRCGNTYIPKNPDRKRREEQQYCTVECGIHRWRAETHSRYRLTSRNGKRIALHRARAEDALGHPLPPGAQVHHVDGTTSDHSRLVICPDAAYHAALERRMRIKKAGGDPWNDSICCACHAVKPATEFYVSAKNRSGVADKCKECCRTASRNHMRIVYARRREEKRRQQDGQ